jgi:hypothetical protein
MGKILECIEVVLSESRILALEEKGSHRWRFARQNVDAAISQAGRLEKQMARLQAKFDLKQHTLSLANSYIKLFELLRDRAGLRDHEMVPERVERLIKRVDAIPCTCTVYDDYEHAKRGAAANVVVHPDDVDSDGWYEPSDRYVSRCTRCVALGRILDRVPES